MARLESVAVAGYYPTPPHLIPLIAQLLVPPEEREAENYSRPRVVAFDPCAGDGAALVELTNRLGAKAPKWVAIEMEKSRFTALTRTVSDAHHADAFRARWTKPFASLLYLNPPYDLDREHERLEERFLARFTDSLASGGVLVFVVPHYALAASAETLARSYTDLRCFRFPDDDFKAYRQVVLVAKRIVDEPLAPDNSVALLVRTWALDPASLPVLGDACRTRTAVPALSPSSLYSRSSDLEIDHVDTKALLAKLRPWSITNKAGASQDLEAFVPSVAPVDLMRRVYPVAVPPRPAHIAAGMASGIFNGARVEPNPGSHLPPLLVKGVFDREYRTIEEKVNKDGEVVGEVQVQQPKMVTTVLDLSTYAYHTLKAGTDVTPGKVAVCEMTAADLLSHYSTSLMRVMEQQCPVLYDPRYHANAVTLHPSPRKLFAAQAHAARALVRLLAQPDRAAILLGEIGSGKSTVSVVAARSLGAKRLLILCPPHLLASWQEQFEAIAPDVDVHVLRDVLDLERLAKAVKAAPERPVVGLLSREAAKLGHAYVGVQGSGCPKCGAPLHGGDFAKTRARCKAQTRHPKDRLAESVVELAIRLQPHYPAEPNVASLLDGRMAQTRGDAYLMRNEKRKRKPAWTVPTGWSGLPIVADRSSPFHHIIFECTRLLRNEVESTIPEVTKKAERALCLSLLALADPRLIVETIHHLGLKEYGMDTGPAAQCLLLLPPGAERDQALVVFEKLVAEKRVQMAGRWYDSYGNPVAKLREHLAEVDKGNKLPEWSFTLSPSHRGGETKIEDDAPGTAAMALRAFRAACTLARFKHSPVCDEPLYQGVADPVRLPLARLISRRHRKLFDFLIVDEGHEYATDGSAQERSAHRLTNMGLPTILMTGTIMNGYAESLFSNFWAISRRFRGEFLREHRSLFVERYGFRKRLVEEKQDGEIIAFGSVTDRVERNHRILGNAPGVLPLFLMTHLLPMSVTLHKSDLSIELPKCEQRNVDLKAEGELFQHYQALRNKLIAQIRSDRFKKDLAGKLWGQLAELPSYLDRATLDVGNDHGDQFAIEYPPTVKDGGIVASVPLLPASTILPKEQWMLDLVEAELEAGRNVLVFGWHTKLMPRLARIIAERIGERVPILHADKVSTAKRQDWINKEVIAKKSRVLVANPVTVQTGLNNLVHFSTEVWMQNPACNPLTFRQAIGRVDRIGQTRPTSIYVPKYANTIQTQALDLLMRKVAVSVATDGLDPESALQAAGVAEDSYLVGLSIGKQLYAMLTDNEALEGGASRPKRLGATKDSSVRLTG
jgi:hypothetical protein